MLTRVRQQPDTLLWTVAALLLVALAGVPLLVSGPGNDLDVANIMRSGRSIVSQHTYLASRAPGAPVHETIVGVADLIGGTLLVNLTSLLAAIAMIVGLDRLLAGEGLGPNRRWAIAVFAANPWFVVAATSAIDYLFGLAFVVWSAVALRQGRPVVAGVLGGLAMGCRVGSAMLLAAILFAELTEPRRRHGGADAAPGTSADAGDEVGAAGIRARWVPVVVASVIVAAVTALLMVPSFVAAGGFEFAQNDFRTSSIGNHLGRAGVKNVALFGPVSCLVALLALPALARALRRWNTSWLLRFALPGFVLSQLLFVRFPWKVSHLLPALLCGAVALAVALGDRKRLLVVLVGLQLVAGVVRVVVFTPDEPHRARGAEIGLDVTWGQLVTDWQCRREHRFAYQGRQRVEVEQAWGCSQPFVEEPAPL